MLMHANFFILFLVNITCNFLEQLNKLYKILAISTVPKKNLIEIEKYTVKSLNSKFLVLK